MTMNEADGERRLDMIFDDTQQTLHSVTVPNRANMLVMSNRTGKMQKLLNGWFQFF
jgi:hypothetical protein